MKSRTPQELTTASGVAFEHGFVTGGNAGVSEYFNTNYEFSKFKASVWVQESDTDRQQLTLKVEDQDGVLIKELKVKNGELIQLEIAVKDAKEIHIWVEGDQSILGNPELGK